jgi:hypothetical protein
MAEKSPDQIVADIDRKQNEEDRELPKRAYAKVKELGGKAVDYVKENIVPSMVKKPMEAASKMKEAKPVEKAKGGMIKSSASKRADGCAIRGKTRA